MSAVESGRGSDVMIAGGGPVGLALARALAGSGLRVALADPAPAGAGRDAPDQRCTALSPSSRRILTALGCWDAVARGAAPIRSIHVSDQGGFGITRLRAAEEGVDALGHVVPNRVLVSALEEALAGQRDLRLLRPAAVEDVADHGRHLSLALAGEAGEPWHCRLLVAADGSRSPLRRRLGFRVQEQDYGQTGIVAVVTPERPHEGQAFERFTREGPLALLPLPDGRCSLVWTVRTERSRALLSLDDAGFLGALQAAFGYRLGRLLAAGPRGAWPLHLIRTGQRRLGRALLAGNAAHTLHPVAGQGFNLALRDVADLAEVLHRAAAIGDDPGAAGGLDDYLIRRRADDRGVVGFTDTLVRLFSNRLPGVRLARNLGLVAMSLFPGARHRLAHQAMGQAVRPSRLARGLPLADEGRGDG